MNRKELKTAAREAVAASAAPLKRITLVFLICALALVGLDWGVGEALSRTRSQSHYLSQAISAQTQSYVIILIISLICQLALVLLFMGYHAVGLDLSRREEVSMSTLWDGFRLWLKAVALYLYVSLLVGLWATLLTMPVSYILASLYMAETLTMDQIMYILMGVSSVAMFAVSYRYRMFWFILLDAPEKPIRQIVSEAKFLSHNHMGLLFLLDLSFVPWLLLCVLTGGILLIWKLPYIMTTYAGAYQFMLEDAQRLRARMEALRDQMRHRMENRY